MSFLGNLTRAAIEPTSNFRNVPMGYNGISPLAGGSHMPYIGTMPLPQQNTTPPPQPGTFPGIPSYNQIVKANGEINPAGLSYFNQGQSILAPTASGITPQTQTILDYIQKQGDYKRAQAVAEAQALAAKRGVQGSSTEQFGTQEAGRQAEQLTLDAQTQALMQNATFQNANQNTAAKGYFDLTQQQGQLNSDEVASLRNMDYSQRYLEIQKLLGEQGISASRDAANRAADAADNASRDNLIGNIVGGVLPGVVNHYLPAAGAGGGGGVAMGAGSANGAAGLGAGAGGYFGGSLGGTAYAGSPGAASSLFPGGVAAPGGTVGTGAPTIGGAGGLGAANIAMGAGAGLAGWQTGRMISPATQEGDIGGQNIGGALGAGAGFVFGGPVGAYVGGTVGALSGKASNRFQRGIENRAGQTAGDIASMTINPIAGIQKGINNIIHPDEAVKKVTSAVSGVAHKASNAVNSVFPF